MTQLPVLKILLNPTILLTIRCLLDSGTTSTIVLKKFSSKKLRRESNPTKWRTMGGSFVTHHKCEIEFKLPEFSHSRTVTWKAYVDDHTKPEMTGYDLIIGSDLMTELKMTLDYDRQEIMWDEIAVPMKYKGTVSDPQVTKNIYEMTKESSILKMSEDRHNEIIKAMYGAINIREHVKSLDYLTPSQQEKLALVLEVYPDMYEGTIGTLNIPPVHFELKKMLFLIMLSPFQFQRHMKT